MYPAAALMEVVEAHQIRLEVVMDAVDMKTFGLMAVIGKIELDNFRERSTMGKRGAAKQGRAPTGRLPYGYRIGDDGKPQVVEGQAEVVRRIFHMYVHEGMGSRSIAVRLTDEGIPTQTGKRIWRQSYVHHVLGNSHLQDGDASGGRGSPTGRPSARTEAVVGTPAPRADARNVQVSLRWTERVCRTRGWAATSGSSGRRCARRSPRRLLCQRRRAWWGTAAGLPYARATSSSSHRGPGGQ